MDFNSAIMLAFDRLLDDMDAAGSPFTRQVNAIAAALNGMQRPDWGDIDVRVDKNGRWELLPEGEKDLNELYVPKVEASLPRRALLPRGVGLA